jgi:hypothetical protein
MVRPTIRKWFGGKIDSLRRTRQSVVRSPSEGFRTSARHEIAFIVEGTVRVDTAAGSRTVNAHDVIVSSPAEQHATTALTDTTIFFVLIDPPTGV